MTATMAPQKKLASLRLDEDVLERIDAVIAKLYQQLPVAPSRNAVMEAWIVKGLADAEEQAEREGIAKAILEKELQRP